MSPGLHLAILARLRGTEVLTGVYAGAQATTSALKWRFGTMTKKGELPCGNFYFDAGVDAMPRAPDVGIIENGVVRFEVWTETPDAAFFTTNANALEQLFDERRGCPLITKAGDGKVFAHSLMTGMQAPYFDKDTNAWWGLISFQFLEARP